MRNIDLELLLSQMTLDENIGQLTQYTIDIFIESDPRKCILSTRCSDRLLRSQTLYLN